MTATHRTTSGPARTAPAIATGPGTSAVRLWLFLVAALIAVLVTVGGATRLTGSGLSITEWKPIIGILPPLSDAAWADAFEKYKLIPQYHQVNRGMSLDGFKFIFWWEWGHRFLARMIGFAFALPLAVFWWKGFVDRWLLKRLIGILVLGGLQGAMGWYMVASGLVERTSVSQYRLAAHLGLAILLIGLLLWTAFAIGRDRDTPRAREAPGLGTARVLLGLVYLQILLGALVAGMKAGLTYNTWPLMDGHLVPNGLFVQSPWWINLFENAATVQFDHRLLAYAVTVLTLWQVVAVNVAGDERLARSARRLAGLVTAQVALGVWTLLAWVPLWLGLAHQALAVAVFAAAVWHAFAATYPERLRA